VDIVQKTVIVVPCYNEASRLDVERFVAFSAADQTVSFVFVDDGSTDETFAVLSRLAGATFGSTVVRLERNQGKAEAVRRGVLRAFEMDPTFIGFWDADLATPLAYIETFRKVFDRPEAMMVFGSRVQLLGRRIARDPMRHYIGRGVATLAAVSLGLPIYDTQCGAKMFRATPFFRAHFEKPFELGWSFDVELFARILRRCRATGELDPERQLIEFPLEEWIDAPGSKLRARHYPRIAWDLARLYFIARRES
jgi:glycosyltransferase involved in cell wall biosynthesis